MSGAPDTTVTPEAPSSAERTAQRADATWGLGLALPFGVVLVRARDVALDTGRDVDGLFAAVALAVALGVVVSALLARGVRTGSFRPVPAVGLLSGIGWLALWGIGETQWVDLALMASITLSVPALTLAAVDPAVDVRGASAVSRSAHALGWAAAGVGLGAAAVIVAPDRVWSDLTVVGGILAVAACGRRLIVPDPVGSPSAPAVPDNDASLGAALGVAAGAAIGAVGRLGPFLAEEWQVGVRYHAAIFLTAGGVGAAIAVAVRWREDDRRRRHDGGRPPGPPLVTAPVVALTAAGSMAIASVSETVVGIVVGAGLAAAFALVAVMADTSRRTLSSGAIGLAVGAAIVTALWPPMVDALGSERVTLALTVLPLATLAAIAIGKPRQVPESSPADDAVPTPDVAGTPLFADSPLLDVQGLEFSYGSVQVLFGVDLCVRTGEITALVGANGAGKTTLLDNIAGIRHPRGGTIRFGGVDLADFSADERVRCGMNHIGAGTAIAEDLSVADNLAMFGHTLTRREARAGAERAYEVFPTLGERQTQRASLLSGGERQMLALSKSLVLAPRLLIIDEFSLGLAPIVVSGLVPVIRRLHDEGASILLVEQSVNVALELADRATCMERGRIVFAGSADELRSDPGLLEAVYLEGVSAALENRAVMGGPEAT